MVWGRNEPINCRSAANDLGANWSVTIEVQQEFQWLCWRWYLLGERCRAMGRYHPSRFCTDLQLLLNDFFVEWIMTKHHTLQLAALALDHSKQPGRESSGDLERLDLA